MKGISKLTLIVCYFVVLIVGLFYYPKWKQSGPEATISWDASGYYLYLPAIFIYHDIKHCTFKDKILEKYNPTPDFQQAYIHKSSGNYVMKYSSGQAVLMSPFFFLGHAIAKFSHGMYTADGFSYPYQVSLGLGMLLYTFIGLWVLRKILLRYFSDTTVALALICLVMGTNYLNYAAIDQCLTHNTLFTLYCLLIYFSILFYESHRRKDAILIGALVGLCTLIRPTDIVSAIIPLLWGVSNMSELRNRVSFIGKHIVHYAFAAISAVCFISIQIIYWKWSSGDWLVYSYPYEGFDWFHPHVVSYPFSFKSGWLIYCPLMITGFIGLWYAIKQKQNVFAIVGFVFVNFYIVTAWQTWWYGGRAMVQSYPILLFSISALISDVNNTRWRQLLLYPFVLTCIYLNAWWLHNAHRGQIQVYDISKEYYQAVVGKWHVDPDLVKLIDNPDYINGPVRMTEDVYANSFDKDSTCCITPNGINGQSIFLDKDHQSTNEYFFTIPIHKQKWIRASALFKTEAKEYETKKMARFVVRLYADNQIIKERSFRVYRLLSDWQTKELSIDVKLPDHKIDKASILFVNDDGTKRITIDDVKVYLCDAAE